MSSPVENLVQRLNAQRSGKGWKAKCPVHDDHTPSLSINEGADGRALLKCHAGCDNTAILAALDMSYRDLFPATYPHRQGSGEIPKAFAPATELPPAPAPYVPPPLALLPVELQEYVNAASEALNVDGSFIVLPMLSAIASAIGNTRSILLKPGFIQPPVIWTGIVGRSGSRKSPALEAGCFAVMEHERELTRQNKDAATEYDEKLAEWEGKKKAGRGVKPEPRPSLTCLMDDMTLEALADAMQANPRGLLVKKDELSHWLSAFDQYHSGKGADVSRWLSLHTGVFFGLDRRTDHRRYRIYQPRVCITGGIQPKVLARALTEDFFERGLPARFLFAAPPMRKDRWSEDTISGRLRDIVSQRFTELYNLQADNESGEAHPRLLGLDADAKREFIRYYNECGYAAIEGNEHTEAAWSKLSGYAARLALVGQLARNADARIVTGEVMAEACDLARWFGAEAVRIYASLSETPEQAEQRRLVEFIEHRGGTVGVRDVTHYSWLFKGQTDKAKQVLNALAQTGRGEWLEIRPAGGGRPTQKFRLLPASPSPKLLHLRGETANYGDGDEANSQKITAEREPDIEDAVDGWPDGWRKRRVTLAEAPPPRSLCSKCGEEIQGPCWYKCFKHNKDVGPVLCRDCGEGKNDAPLAKEEAEWNKGKTVYSGGMITRTANDGWPRSQKSKCGRWGCGRNLEGEAGYWQRYNRPGLVRCDDCQEAKWLAGGYDVENGLPSSWLGQDFTVKERRAESARHDFQKHERWARKQALMAREQGLISREQRFLEIADNCKEDAARFSEILLRSLQAREATLLPSARECLSEERLRQLEVAAESVDYIDV